MLSEKPWRPDLALRLIAGFYAAMALGMIVGIGYREVLPNSLTREVVSFAVGTFIFHCVTLFLVQIFLRQHQTSWSFAFGFREPRLGRTIFLGAMVGVLVLPVALSLKVLVETLVRAFNANSQLPNQPAVEMLMQATSISQLVIHGIAAIIFAPIVEEIIFRGVLYPAVKRHASRGTALWGVSLLFALTHMNLGALLALAVLGTLLTFLYETTRNLLAPIIAHSVFNAANFALLVFNRYSEGAL
jgi:membrane protease YdiL (CAAX protease family)